MWSEVRGEYLTTSPAGGGGDVTTGAETCTHTDLFKAPLKGSEANVSLLPNFLADLFLSVGMPGALLRGMLSLPD